MACAPRVRPLAEIFFCTPGEYVTVSYGEKKSKWTDQLAEELHKPVTRQFRRRKVYVNGIDKIWAADLVDMQNITQQHIDI